MPSPTEALSDVGARERTAPEPPPDPAEQSIAPRVSVVPSRTIDCWSCDTPNTPSRMFCVSCGSFIAIGSQGKAAPEAAPFSGPPPVPGDADTDASLPLVEGVVPLGSYSVEEQRRASRRTRTLTAVTSVVMAMVVGAAALYLASPMSDRADVPETAAVVSATTVPGPTDQTGAVSGVTIEPQIAQAPDVVEPEAVVEPERDTEPEPEAEAEPADAPEPVAEPIETVADPEPITEPEPVAVADPEPAIEPEPVAVADPEPATEPEPVVGEPVSPGADAADPVRSVALPAEEEPAGYDGGWVCNEEIAIEDSRARDWSLSRVSFRPRGSFDRVVLHLDRAGPGSGDSATIAADSMGSWKVEESIRGAARPGLGRRSITLRLDDGFIGSLALRGYRPSGLDVVKEFSTYSSGRDGRNVVISADTDGCYRVRVPAWNDPSASVRRAEIHVDIKP